jgi:hypothetical protein
VGRLLDILAWKSKGGRATDEPDDITDETANNPR